LISLSFVEPQFEKMSRTRHRDNFREVLTHIFTADPVLRLTFLNYVIWSLSTFYAVWLLQKYWELNGIPLAFFGVLWGVFNLSSGIMGTQVHRLESSFGTRPLMFWLSWMPIVAYLGMGLLWGWAGVALSGLFALSRGITQVLIADAFNWRVPSKFRATANSIKSLGFRLVFAITGPAVGYGIDQWGMSETLLVLGVIYFALFFVSLFPLVRLISRSDSNESRLTASSR
jgi:hypothetical protein